MTSPGDLRIDSGGDQFAVSGPTPRLSFRVPREIGALISTELEASIDDEALPAVTIDGDRHLFLEWPWEPLTSGRRVSWRARAVGMEATSEWSEYDRFESGLFDADWTASWISPVETDIGEQVGHPAYALTGLFDLPAGVLRARLYATALGVYDARVNGTRVGTAELLPGTTSYDLTLLAQASDVTGALVTGRNRIELVLSDGWYRGEVGAFRRPSTWGSILAVRAELHVDLADGDRRVIRTDGGWSTVRSKITRASLMDGETLDLLAAPDEAQPVLVDRVRAPSISWSPAPPVRVIETRTPVSVRMIRDGVWIADFGQNASGWLRLSDLGPRGARTIIDHGEYLDSDGDLSTSHLDSSAPDGAPVIFVQRDVVVSDGSDAEFEPRHTVHGFRYARIAREGGHLDPGAVVMQVVHTDLRRAGSFASSDPDLDRLHEIADWSFRGNAVDVPTDCPTRERLAWTGDYQVFAPTATRLYDVLGFTRKWLRAVRDDQLADGRIANFSPDGRRIKHNLDDRLAMMTGSAGWGDAIVAVPWEMYESYGDTAILAENWSAMRRWVEWALQNARTSRHASRRERSPEPAPHEAFLWDGSFHWGEWCEPPEKDTDGNPIDPIQHNPVPWFTADKGEVATAYLYRSTKTLGEIARVLGRDEDARRYATTARSILEAWRTEFLLPDGRTKGDTQACYVRAISFGLVPDAAREGAASRLVELIRAADTHLGTGFLSTGDLLPVLSDTGHGDLAYELLFQRTAPSWRYMLDRGATTIWESWEGVDDNGRAHESLNHYSKGAVIRFLHTHVLGLRQAAGSIAWTSFVVAPVPGGALRWARGSHDGPQGRINVEWRLTADGLEVSVDVPVGSTARIEFPSGETRRLGPGSSTVIGRV